MSKAQDIPAKLAALIKTEQPFRKWLEDKRPNEIVGRRVDSTCCPMARFIRDSGCPDAQVTSFYAMYDPVSLGTRLPDWAHALITLVDAGWNSEWPRTGIQARTVLKLLDRVRAG